MHDNKFNSYKVPSGLLILFLEKALTLIHMETHLNDVSTQPTARQSSIWLSFPLIRPVANSFCPYRTRNFEFARFRFLCSSPTTATFSSSRRKPNKSMLKSNTSWTLRLAYRTTWYRRNRVSTLSYPFLARLLVFGCWWEKAWLVCAV
jgi:hypothetical protein